MTKFILESETSKVSLGISPMFTEFCDVSNIYTQTR